MDMDAKTGWFARRKGQRRAARERERLQQEQLEALLAEYPVDPSQRPKPQPRHSGGWGREREGWVADSGWAWGGYGGGSGSADDCHDGGFLSSVFGGDWGGGFGGGDGGGGC